MANLGSPKTRKAAIGTFEVRVGPLNKASLLTADNSIGIIDNVKLDFTIDSVQLLAGFPQKPVDTAVTKLVNGLTATFREYSRRNFNILIGNAVFDYDLAATVVSGTVDTTTAIAAGATSIVMTAGFTGAFVAGDTVVIYDVNNPANVCIVQANTWTAGTKTLTLLAATPLTAAGGGTNVFAAGTVVKAYKAQTIAGGALNNVNYFSMQLLRLDRGTNSPVGCNIWKAAIAGSSSIGAGVTDFASSELQVTFLEPAASEYAVGGSLVHLATVIPANPAFMWFDVSDAA